MENFNKLKTEQRNQKTINLDTMLPLEIISIMNEEDCMLMDSIKKELPVVANAIDKITTSIKKGGRLIYIGAGTSGRLGILDAAECKPTFSTTNEVIAIIAGGEKAISEAVEGAEDSFNLAKQDLIDYHLTNKDVVFSIAASGRTPYAIGALQYAKEIGATAIGLCCNKGSAMKDYSDIIIEIETGPEILTGSTRLKAGTATKIILNMISTATMVQLGKTYSNLMVDVKTNNTKLVERAKKIVMEATECSYEEADETLQRCEFQPKVAIIMLLLQYTKEEAENKLIKNPKIVEIINQGE